MVRETHIITCGLSLLTNTVRSALSREIPLEIEESRLRSLANPREVEVTLRSLSDEEKEALERAMVNLLEGNPRKASAEMNAFYGYLEEFERGGVEEVHLIVSDTEAGRFTANALMEYLERRGFNVSKHTVRGFGSEDFELALRNLRETVRSIVVRSKEVVLNLTGGFKAEIAALSVLAAESGLRAYYIHESARRVAILPTASELKVKYTSWEKALGILTVLLSVPLDSLLGLPLFAVVEIALLVPAMWILLRKV